MVTPDQPESVSFNVGANISGAESSISDAQGMASEGQSFELNAETSSAEKDVNSLHEAAHKSESMSVTARIFRSSFDKLLEDIDKDRTMKVTVKYEEKDKPDGLAVGTSSAKGGISLVDEKGAELIEHVSNGTFELGTDNGPRFTKLEKGDVVHTASETKRILSRLGNLGGVFKNGLNQAKSIIGNAFSSGSVTGGVSLKSIQRVTSSVKKGSKDKSKPSSSKTKSEVKGFTNWAEKLFDWAEIKLDRLKSITNAWLLDVKNTVNYIKKNAKLDSAIKSVNKEIKYTEKAYKLYLKQAAKVANKGGLSKSIVQKIQDGSIKISGYSEDVQERIRRTIKIK